MKTKETSLVVRVLCLILVLAMLPAPVYAAQGLEVFQLPEEMPALPFTDVPENSWYHGYVQVQYALGMMKGMSGDTFSPNGTVPLSQAVTVAVRIYEKYNGLTDASAGYGRPWYTYYIDRAKEYGILPENLYDASVSRAVTRAELAEILSRCLPAQELEAINQVDTLPDYTKEDAYWNGVITLYRAGVLIGDEKGRFLPDNGTRRSELAAMLTRLVFPEYRIAQSEEPDPTDPDETEPTAPTDPGPAPEMTAFQLSSPLPQLPFTDVSTTAWHHGYIQAVYSLGLMQGMSSTVFSPNGTVPLSQVVTVAVRIYEKYNGLPDEHVGYGGSWYTYYMDRAKEYGILPRALYEASPTRTAFRAEVAAILYRSLPLRELSAINQVDTLPDYDSTNAYWDEVIALYRAGILTGNDQYGTFGPTNAIRRSELATMLTRLVCPSYRRTFTLTPKPTKHLETIVYGKSGAGRELKAYRYGDGKNVMVLAFAIHGWEDNFDRDGQMLVDTAEALMDELEKRYDTLVRSGDWSVYVLPCLNPDGLLDGWTCNGPGRCTTYYLSNGSNTYGKGIDLNRSFPYQFQSRSDSRNFNGYEPLQAREAQALAEFVKSVKGSGSNVLIDTHGWYRQTIVSGGSSGAIYRTFANYFPGNSYTSLAGGSGYFASWAAYVVGYDACLFEFPNVSSASDFRNKGYAQDYIDAICDLLTDYN